MDQSDKRTVLIIDDDEPLRMELADFLRQRDDWWVDVSASAQDALKKMGRSQQDKETKPPYDIIILDLLMREGEMSGLEFLERVKREQDLMPKLYIIVLSGYLDHKRILEIKSLGARDFIRKRDLYDDLFTRIEAGIHWQEQRERLMHYLKINQKVIEVDGMLKSLLSELQTLHLKMEDRTRLLDNLEHIMEKIALMKFVEE